MADQELSQQRSKIHEDYQARTNSARRKTTIAVVAGGIIAVTSAVYEFIERVSYENHPNVGSYKELISERNSLEGSLSYIRSQKPKSGFPIHVPENLQGLAERALFPERKAEISRLDSLLMGYQEHLSEIKTKTDSLEEDENVKAYNAGQGLSINSPGGRGIAAGITILLLAAVYSSIAESARKLKRDEQLGALQT